MQDPVFGAKIQRILASAAVTVSLKICFLQDTYAVV